MPTRRGTGLLLAASLCYAAARALGIPELHLVAVAALVLVALALAIVWAGPTRLRIRRRLRPDRIHADEQATLDLEVANTGRLPTAPLVLRDTLPVPATTRLPMLAPRSAMTLRLTIPGTRRGRNRLGPARVQLRDPFGLVARERVLPGTCDLVVYPRVVPLPPGLPLGGGTGVTGAPGSRPRPTSHDLADLREYVQGDDLRSVHWPSTAHRGKLMVRTSEAPEDARAVVVLDRRAEHHLGVGAEASFETAVSAAASVVRHLADRGRAVSLVTDPVAAAPEPAPWRHWLEELAELDTAPVDLVGLLGQLARGIAGDGVLVAVLTPPDPAERAALVRAGRGFSTRVALLVDPASHAVRSRDAVRAGQGDRSVAPAAAALQAAGWRVAVLHRGDPLAARWQELVLASRRAVAT